MNKQIEIMKALVENGGPKEMWVPVYKGDWIEKRVTGVDLIATKPYTTDDGYSHADVSLTDPNKTYAPLGPWVNDWAKFRAVDRNGQLFEFDEIPHLRYGKLVKPGGSRVDFISLGHDPTNWENSLEERKRTTRPMTPREFARFVGEHMGKYLYRAVWWNSDDWTSNVVLDQNMDPTDWLYAENVPGELEWRELPEVEG